MKKDSKKIGIVMPISKIGDKDANHWKDVKDFIIDSCKEISDYDIKISLVSDDDKKEIIHKKIVSNLYENDLVICDLSENNPNVLFELGMRLAFNKPTIIIKDESTKYNFDSGIINHISYPDDLHYKKMDYFRGELVTKIKNIFELIKENKYESFLDSLSLKSVQTANIEYQDVDFNEFVIETLKSIEYSLYQLNGQNKESKSNPKRKKPLLREPLQKSLDNLEIDYLFSDKTGSAIGFDSLKKEYESNNELQLLMDFNTFLTFTITYFEDKNITVIPF